MSRASFNIRKLIKTWPDNDDDEEAFECSSARTIRVQYELEQYQSQHIQKARHDHKHRSWISHPSGPKTKDLSKALKPISSIGHASSGSETNAGSRRISTPLPLSSLSARTNPEKPLSLRSSAENLSSPPVGDPTKEQQSLQQLSVPRSHPEILDSESSQIPKTITSGGAGYDGPLSAPFEQSPSIHNDTSYLPASGLHARGYSLSSARQSSPLHTRTSHHESLDNAPTVFLTSARATNSRSNRSSYVMDGRIQRSSAFLNGQPSPPLEPDVIKSHVIDSKEVLREIPSVSTLSLDGESNENWFREGKSLSDVSDNVQQLIRETDEAFKAVSSALAEARQASQSPAPFDKMQSPLQNLQQVSHALHKQTATAKRSPTVDEPQAVSPISPTPCAGRGRVAPHGKASRTPSSLLSAPHIIKPPMSTTSVSKSKKGSMSPKAKAMRSAPHESSLSRSPREPLARGTGGPRPHHSYHKSISRFNLAADKVTDKLFEGRNGRFGFIKVEADEVVTPEQVERFRRNRIAKQVAAAKRHASQEFLRTAADDASDEHASDADVEPLHLQDLSSKTSYPAVNALSPVIEVATPDFFEIDKGAFGQLPNLDKAGSFPEVTKEVKIGQDPLATPPPTPPQRPIDGTEDDESMNLKILGLSKLSNRRHGHKRSTSSTSHVASLPTIPEVKITAPPAWDVSRPSQQQQEHKRQSHKDGRVVKPTDTYGNPYFEEDDEHMFLMSNSITSTMPTFKHGRIRLAKADLVNAGTINSLESKLLTSPDETLDWTAFQMAILGGAGDLFSDPDNFLSRDAQEEMVDDLCDWFEDLGFTNDDLGTLVTKDRPRKGTRSRAPYTPLQPALMMSPGSADRVSQGRKGSADSRSSSVGSGLTRSGDSPDHSIPIPVEIEHPSGFWNAADSNDTDRFHTGPGLKRWTLEGHPKRYQGAGIDVNRANSHTSTGAGNGLPRTPRSGGKSMRASIDSLPQSPMLELRMMTGVDGNKEFVSMGYNLNHDLGDFLRWESEHVYAPGFYGSE